MKRLLTPVSLGLGALLSLAACTDSHDQGQRAANGVAGAVVTTPQPQAQPANPPPGNSRQPAPAY
jgi:hypothetical protein